jgi:hypothetical protein
MTIRGKISERVIIVCRIEKYERDLKRWEFMDEESQREQ